MDRKVKLYPCPVDAPIQIHDAALRAAQPRPAQHLQYTYRLFLFLFHALLSPALFFLRSLFFLRFSISSARPILSGLRCSSVSLPALPTVWKAPQHIPPPAPKLPVS